MAKVKPVNKKKMRGPTLAALIVSIVILLAMVVSLVASSGIFVRAKVGASSDNFEVNASMMSYYTNSYYQNWYSNYYYYILLGYISFDPSTPLNEQYTDATKTQTYYDFFVSGAKNTVTTYLKYCEAALADKDVNYDDMEKEAEDYADEAISEMKAAAKANSMDLTTYIRQYFGEYVNKSDLRKALIIEHIAASYYDTVHQRIYDAMDDDRKKEYFENNLASFVSAEYLAYTLSSTKTVTYPKAEDYVGGADSAAYKAAINGLSAENAAKINIEDYEGGADSVAYKKDLKTAEDNLAANKESLEADKALIEKLSAAETEEEFKRILLDAKFEENFTSAYNSAVSKFTDDEKPSDEVLAAFKESVKQKIIDAVIAEESDIYTDEEAETADDATAWEKAEKTLPASVITKLNTVITNATKTGTYTLSSVLGNKLFGGIKAQFGIDYEAHETQGTNAAVNSHWMDDILQVNVTNVEISIKIMEASISKKAEEVLAEEDEDKKKELEEEKKTLEKSLEDLKEDLEEAKDKLENLETTGYYSYAAYFVTKEAYRDETVLRDVGHILFKVEEDHSDSHTHEDTYYATFDEAKTAAEALLAQIDATKVNGVVEKDVFESFGADTHDSNVFYEGVNKGEMVEEFENWLFSATTKGETGLVKTEHGYHIMWYGGEVDEAWRVAAHDAATDEDLGTWFEELDYEVTVNDDIFAIIFG